MRRVLMVAAAALACATPTLAAPLQIDFNVAGFGPAPGTTDTFTKAGVAPGLDLKFQSMDASFRPAHRLYWDADDGGGFADGFGVMGSGSYEDDEVEGPDERLALWFSVPVHLLAVDLTDLFAESLPAHPCPGEGCYNEWGAALFMYADGTQSLFRTFGAPDSNVLGTTNGLLRLALDEHDVVGLLLQAPGEIFGGVPPGYRELHDFSLTGVTVDIPAQPVPEPGTLLLLGAGLAVVARRQKASLARPAGRGI